MDWISYAFGLYKTISDIDGWIQINDQKMMIW